MRPRSERSLPPGLLCLVALGACRPEPAAASAVRLEGVRPRERTAVALNEEIVLTFSEAIEPTSVSRESLFVADADGEHARGEWAVEGRVVRFRPAPVLARDLSDGGFAPDSDYEVRILGFPRLDGLRGVSGAPLDRCQRYALHTVALGGGALVLEDQSPAACAPARLPQRSENDGRLRIAVLEPIRITCPEPLDPSTLSDDDFWILATEVDAHQRPLANGTTRRIDLRGSFRENAAEGTRAPLQPCAVIELMPSEALSPRRRGTPGWLYELQSSRQPMLADFRGNRAWWARDSSIEIEVTPSERHRHGQAFLHFLDRVRLQPSELPEYDGLACCTDTGLLGIRFPAAAGDGAHGDVELTGSIAHTDVRGVRVSVPSGVRAELPSGPGLRIVRAQKRLEISGELVRRSDSDTRPVLEPFERGETVSAFLERIRREGRDWTVLVAGGDLCVRREALVQVDTPLLLVAGGWIRIEGREDGGRAVVAPPGSLWLFPDGGGAADPTASVPPLVMDPPATNPLVEELRVAVVTSQIPSRDGTYHWLGAEVGGRAGAGRYAVRFLSADGEIARAQTVEHPGLLPPGPVRVLFELSIPPGGAWDPPTIDHLVLDWEEEEEVPR